MPEQVLINHAPEIYSPFASAEVGRLREYVETVDSLVGMKAITETWSWKIEIVPDGNGASEQMDYVGEEALHDAAGRFRLLYDHKEGMSFDAVRALLYVHVADHESPLQEQALAEFKILGKMKKQALKSPLMVRVGDTVLTSHDIIDLHLSGRYLHREAEKVALLENLSVIARAEYLELLQRLAHVFKVGSAVVEPILATPSLLAA